MKNKALRMVLLTVAIIICLSVGLYAAHSLGYGKVSDTASITSTEDGGPKIVTPIHETDRRLLRKAD